MPGLYAVFGARALDFVRCKLAHTSVPMIECRKCFSIGVCWFRHVTQQHRGKKMFPCSVCQRQWDSKLLLARHLFKKHKMMQENLKVSFAALYFLKSTCNEDFFFY